MTKVALPESPEEEEGFTTPLQPHTILLKDDETIATMYPIPCDPALFPKGLLKFIHEEFNMEIAKGSSFPYYETLDESEFQDIWFHQDGHLCIMVLGELPELDYSATNSQTDLQNNYGTEIRTARHQNQYLTRKKNKDFQFLQIQWEKQCLGVFSLQPAFPGRSSHIATGNFLVNAGIRGKGIGKTLVDTFLEWATHLGFTSAYFPLVYGTNVGMRRILEELNFRRVGMLPASGILKGFDIPIDSFIYEKELTSITKSIDMLKGHDKNNSVAKYERMLYYMEHKKYPMNCDKTEKARIRMHSKKHTLENGKIMFKGKEVIYNPIKQHQIAQEVHSLEHAGVNKVTSKISKKYHWNGIKQTVAEIISGCQRCHARYPDEVGVVVTQGDNVTQAHMLPNKRIKAQDLVRITHGNSNNNNNNDRQSEEDEETHVDIEEGGEVSEDDQELHLANVVNNVASTVSNEQSQQERQLEYDGVTPRDGENSNIIHTGINKSISNHNNEHNEVPTPPDRSISQSRDQRTVQHITNQQKRTYESAVQHGFMANLNSSGATNNNNNNIPNDTKTHNYPLDINININETIDMNMRRLNKIVEEEERRKRPRNKSTSTNNTSNEDHSDAMYAFNNANRNTINSGSNSNNGSNSGGGNNNNNNNHGSQPNNTSNMLTLDPTVMAALDLVSKHSNGIDTQFNNFTNNNHNNGINNSTNIPLIFDFGDDYLEEEDEDYEENEDSAGEKEEEEEGDDGDDFADQLEELSIEHELQSLQKLGEDDLNFGTTIPHQL